MLKFLLEKRRARQKKQQQTVPENCQNATGWKITEQKNHPKT